MASHHRPNYGILDQPQILSVLFHPRPDYGQAPTGPSAHEVMIPVEETVAVAASFHSTSVSGPNILFFHGNGEIVADYADIAPLYNGMGINFLAADYRGYGKSEGNPTVTGMMKDCHVILDWTRDWLMTNGFTGPLVVMGRSLGSASALELSSRRSTEIDGLIVESGFAFASPLLELLGISPVSIGFKEEEGFGNIDKIKRVDKPTLIIHAEYDHIIPFSDGKALYEASPSKNKTLLMISGANHNDIFARGPSEYFGGIKTFAQKLTG